MILGITGKIASGKTEVMKILEKKGFFCVYADKIVHDLYEKNGEGAKRICAVFGKEFLNRDGSVNRKKLGELVFLDENKLKLLNNIIHPIVYEEIEKIVGKSKKDKIAIEAVYFDESALFDFVDRIIWIDRPKKRIIDILLNERKISPEIVENVYASINKSSIDFVVNNDSDLKSLGKKIEKVLVNC